MNSKPICIYALQSDDTVCCLWNEIREIIARMALCHPFAPGLPPDGEIANKPGTDFCTTPTFRFPDQILMDHKLRLSSIYVRDLDDHQTLPEGNYSASEIADLANGAYLRPDYPDGTIDEDVTWLSCIGNSAFDTRQGIHMPGNQPPFSYPGPDPGTGCQNWQIKLKVNDDSDPVCGDDPYTEVDSVTYRVYKDHLARDIQNEGALDAMCTTAIAKMRWFMQKLEQQLGSNWQAAIGLALPCFSLVYRSSSFCVG